MRFMKKVRFLVRNFMVIAKMPKNTVFTIDYTHSNTPCTKWAYIASTSKIIWNM